MLFSSKQMGEFDSERNEMDLKERELSALEEVILTVTSSLEINDVLEKVVEVTAKTINADDLFIYLLDKENNELVLSAATKNQAYIYKGEFRIKVGQGVTGYVALTHEPYLIQSNPKKESRFYITPELGDSDYESFLCVPIMSTKSNLIGVMSIYSHEPYFFHTEHTRMAERIGFLVAGALDNAKIYEIKNRRAYVLEKLTNFSINNIPNMSIKHILEMITKIISDILDTELTLIILYESTEYYSPLLKKHLQIKNNSNNSNEKIKLVQKNIDRIKNMISHETFDERKVYFKIENNIYKFFKNYISAKIVIGNDILGSIHCFRDNRLFLKEDESILKLIANQTTLIIKNRILEEKFKKINEKKIFFKDIELGNVLKSDLESKLENYGLSVGDKHIFLVGYAYSNESENKELEKVLNDFIENIKKIISKFISVINRKEILFLFPMIDKSFLNNLKQLIRKKQIELANEGVYITIGISQPIKKVDEYSIAIIEARESLAIGLKLFGRGNIYSLEDVSYYLYLNQFSNGIQLREPYRIRVEEIIKYDDEFDTELFKTLEFYLEYGGNIKKASSFLYAHRNTIYKRIKRIEAITDMDLSNEKHWFPLQLAMKIYKIQKLI